jgi:parvulin-like peptidyl-prolyl isomerase
MSKDSPSFLAGLARQPLLHFLVLGVAISSLYLWLGERDAAATDTTIKISAAEISRLSAGWQARWNRPPTQGELDGMIQAQIREAALYREAVAMGLDKNDPVIRRVLVQKLEGMARDLVELSLSPTDQDLSTYFAENSERYRPRSLITFTHVFIDPDKREDRTLDDAAEMLAQLQALDNPADDAGTFGDAFMLQSYYPEKDEGRIGSLFGREFARQIFELEEGIWHGPVLSGYGTHLVYVLGLQEYPVPPLAEVKDRVMQDWVEENREEITGKYFAALLARYEVIIEQVPDAGDQGLNARDQGVDAGEPAQGASQGEATTPATP